MNDSLICRRQFKVLKVLMICVLSWLFAVAFALLVSSCTKQQTAEPAPEIVRAPVPMRRMQMETEDIMSVIESQPANMVKREIKTRIKPEIKTKQKTHCKVKLKRKAAVHGEYPVMPATPCDDFDLTVIRDDWTLHITP